MRLREVSNALREFKVAPGHEEELNKVIKESFGLEELMKEIEAQVAELTKGIP